MKRIVFVVCIIVMIIFIIFVYPRPFKKSDLEYLRPDAVNAQALDFESTGLFGGCQIEVYSIAKQFLNVKELATYTGSFSSRLEPLFSPWVSALDEILLETSYYNTLNFDECTQSLQKHYIGLNWDEVISNPNELSLFRVGGMTRFSIPLSHADTIVVATIINNNSKLIILKGGR
ncbi:hypothetical protein PsAD37_03275 [Pseudovibrio sp. Ad37]|nr:hypothetical protein PsAD37_03275 [Pseudovibrio sp. Ad37]